MPTWGRGSLARRFLARRKKHVGVDIPIYDVGRASLRNALIGRSIGGRFGESGSHVIVGALRNTNLEARDGDRIALVGDNGSGKSTLPMLFRGSIHRVTAPSRLPGNVSPMFDATLGMSMDATGLENIQIAGTIWGLTRSQIKNNIDDIADFTELGDYLNVPVRTYSNGMMLRLASAIATARNPEILLIDEIVGVGNVGFFDKAFTCIGRLAERSRIFTTGTSCDDFANNAARLSHRSLVAYGTLRAYSLPIVNRLYQQ